MRNVTAESVHSSAKEGDHKDQAEGEADEAQRQQEEEADEVEETADEPEEETEPAGGEADAALDEQEEEEEEADQTTPAEQAEQAAAPGVWSGQPSTEQTKQPVVQKQQQGTAAAPAPAQAAEGLSVQHARTKRKLRCAVYNNVIYHVDVAAGMAWAFQVTAQLLTSLLQPKGCWHTCACVIVACSACALAPSCLAL